MQYVIPLVDGKYESGDSSITTSGVFNSAEKHVLMVAVNGAPTDGRITIEYRRSGDTRWRYVDYTDLTEVEPQKVFFTGYAESYRFIVEGADGTGSVIVSDTEFGEAVTPYGLYGSTNGMTPEEIGGAVSQVGKSRINSNSIVLMGDSITAFHGGYSTATPAQAISGSPDSKGFFNVANCALGRFFNVIGNSGIGGQTSTQIAARFDTDVLDLNPGWVQILAGTNDISIDEEVTESNLKSMYEQARDAGILVIACSIPPQSSATSESVRQKNIRINKWISDYCAGKNWIFFADIGSKIYSSGTTWEPVANTLYDGTHPSAFGAAYMSKAIIDAVGDFALSNGSDYPLSNGDTSNLLSNPSLDGTGTSVPTGWGITGGATSSYVSDPSGGLRILYKATATTGNSAFLTSNVSVGSGYEIGERLVAEIEVYVANLDLSPAANTQSIRLSLQAYDGSSFTASSYDLYWDPGYENCPMPDVDGYVRLKTTELTVPSGTTIVQIYAALRGGGEYTIKSASVRNLDA